MRRLWQHRILLEATGHSANAFVTLTYDPSEIPEGNSLRKKDVQDWLKRFRKSIEPARVRYYLAGEYGDQTQRPHYHVALFGYPPCSYGQSRYRLGYKLCCPSCEEIKRTWGKGQIDVGQLEPHSAQYIAGYVVKKMTGKDDPRLNGRAPEFSLKSLKPGLGHNILHDIASELMSLGLDKRQVDVPSNLSHGKKILPLGRYLRRKLRTLIGKDENTPPEVLEAYYEEMWALFENSPDYKEGRSYNSYLSKKVQQKVASMEARARIYKGAKSL